MTPLLWDHPPNGVALLAGIVIIQLLCGLKILLYPDQDLESWIDGETAAQTALQSLPKGAKCRMGTNKLPSSAGWLCYTLDVLAIVFCCCNLSFPRPNRAWHAKESPSIATHRSCSWSSSWRGGTSRSNRGNFRHVKGRSVTGMTRKRTRLPARASGRRWIS